MSRIVIIHLGRKGAGPVFNFEMARALHNQGHDVVLYACADVENKERLLQERFKTRFFDTYNSRWEYIESVVFRRKINKVLKAIELDNPSIVYSTMNHMWDPFLFPRIKNRIRVKTIHDVGVHEGGEDLINKWWNNSNFKDAEKFIILSRKFVPELIKRGIKEQDICVIPHAGFDYYIKNKVDTVKIDKNLVLFFGRIDAYKGIDVLVDAFELVIKKRSDARLRIVGNGKIEDSVLSKIERLKNNVELVNRWIKDDEVYGFVKDALFVVLPYTHATQSGVIPLAYAFSKPVIATNVGCLDEQVIEGQTGYLVAPKDTIALSEKILKMLESDETVQMGINANNYMKEHLTWEASASKLLNFFNHENINGNK